MDGIAFEVKKSDVPQWLKKLKPPSKNGSQWNIFNDIVVDE